MVMRRPLISWFATIFALVCKYGSKYGLYGLCYRFALEQAYFCIIFALSKFDANPFFRPVAVVTKAWTNARQAKRWTTATPTKTAAIKYPLKRMTQS